MFEKTRQRHEMSGSRRRRLLASTVLESHLPLIMGATGKGEQNKKESGNGFVRYDGPVRSGLLATFVYGLITVWKSTRNHTYHSSLNQIISIYSNYLPSSDLGLLSCKNPF